MSALMHFLIILWASGHMDGATGTDPRTPPRVLRVQLNSAATAAAPATPAAKHAATLPDRQPEPAREAHTGSASHPPEDAAGATASRAALPATAPPATEPMMPPHQFNVDLPPSARLTFDLHSVKPNSLVEDGEGLLEWRQDGARYDITLETAAVKAGVREQTLRLTSNGMIDDGGIAPSVATEQARGMAQSAMTFAHDQDRIIFSDADASAPLFRGTQDKATLPIQLAGIARANVHQLDADITIMVGAGRQARPYRFVVQGEEQLDTVMGTLSVWRLTQRSADGATLDVWLAPALGWYPAQIRTVQSDTTSTTLTLKQITPLAAGQ